MMSILKFGLYPIGDFRWGSWWMLPFGKISRGLVFYAGGTFFRCGFN